MRRGRPGAGRSDGIKIEQGGLRRGPGGRHNAAAPAGMWSGLRRGLGGRCPAPAFPAAAGVERLTGTLALGDRQRVPMAVIGGRSRGGAGLGAAVGEEQQIGDVLAARRALLRQVVGPSQQFQHRADELLLGDRLVGILETGELLALAARALPKLGKRTRGRGGGSPLVRGLDALGQVVLGE